MTDKLSFNFRKWRSDGLTDLDGVIVASDCHQEWLLPWWWENYSRFNSHGVAFVDYGMSEEMRAWCQERGVLIDLILPDIFEAGNSMLNLIIADKPVEGIDADFWDHRTAWLKKPLACLQSPYRRSLWIDLDCEVRGCIGELFDAYGHSLAVIKDIHQNQTCPLYPIYNSGVIVFKQGISVIEKWADMAIDQNHTFLGDQDILSWLLNDNAFVELPGIYNWSRLLEENPQAKIMHWHGPVGKKHIQNLMCSR